MPLPDASDYFRIRIEAKRKALDALVELERKGSHDTSRDTNYGNFSTKSSQVFEKFGGDDETRTRDLCRDRWKVNCDRYRTKSDLNDLVAEKLSAVREAAKCPRSSDPFVEYVEDVYLPFVLRTMKPSTYAGYSTYWNRYIKPRVGKYALRDFTVAIVASLLKDIANMHKLNRDTVTKIRSIFSGIFSYAMSEGHFPARSVSENSASHARIPESATEPRQPAAATREHVKAVLAALKEMPLERAAVALIAMLGVRPGEARGLRWEDWDRVKQQIAVTRAIWHTIEGTPKTPQSVRLLAVSAELREVLLALWKKQESPLGGYILAASNGGPIILDNLVSRPI